MNRKILHAALALAVLPCSGIAALAQDAADTAPTEPGVIQEFEIDRSDRMTVPVQVNGSIAVPFVVDTGSERTVIANDLAKRLALELGPRLTLATISGQTQVDSYFISKLTSAAVSLEDLEAPGLERSNLGAYGLLGIDSLEDSRVLLDFANQRMEVLPSQRKKGRTRIENGMIVVNATKRAGRMIISTAKIDGVRVEIILDTGAQSSMANNALKAKLRARHLRTAFIPVTMRSVTGVLLAGEYSQIKQVEIGGLTINDLPITFADNYAFKALKMEEKPAILLGMDAMKLFDRVMIDFGNRRVGFDLPKGVERRSPARMALAQ